MSGNLSRTMNGYVEGLKFAADLVHQEARWAAEQNLMGDPHARFTMARLIVLEEIMKQKIDSIQEESKSE